MPEVRRQSNVVPIRRAATPAVREAPKVYTSTTPDLVDICHRIMELQVQRRYLIVTQSRADRSIEGLLARMLGYQPEHAKEDRKALFKFAANMRRKIEKAGPDWQSADLGPQWPGVAAYVLQSAAGRAVYDNFRDTVEADMRKLARQLPVWQWVREVRGVAELGLAVIVGETGDLGGYATPAKVWKRLGLAVIEGERQRKKTDKAEASAHGYNPQRRAEVWAFLSDIMFRVQWRGDRDEDGRPCSKSGKPVAVTAHAIGPYGEVYAERKAWSLARGWTPAHADADARRVMSKCFLRDLWIAWGRRATAVDVEPNQALSPAAD